MSYTRHASHMKELFGKLGVDTTKLTHELRIFAAQLLYEMGVSLEVRGTAHVPSCPSLLCVLCIICPLLWYTY
jgi:hypothetical protein